ncbi:hypothetical protein PUN28_013750 [Cardiocondyla obscurior]|uniref:Uncharacterized protein n=1 Tax=Cardiocondyla obscurior TaxID=286306 RepID=A0AAW2F6G0_9HYME
MIKNIKLQTQTVNIRNYVISGGELVYTNRPSKRGEGTEKKKKKKKKNVRLNLPSREVHNDIPTFVKGHVMRRRKPGSRDGVSNRHQPRSVVLMPA